MGQTHSDFEHEDRLLLPQFQECDHIKDFQCNIFSPTNNINVIETFGTKSSLLTFEANETIKHEIKFDLETTAPKLITRYTNLKYLLYVTYALCLFVIPLLVLIIILSQTKVIIISDKNSRNKNAMCVECILVIIFVAVAIGCFVYVKVKSAQLTEEWRYILLQKFKLRISEWKCMFPELTFTLIFPIYVHQQKTHDSSGGDSNGDTRNKNKSSNNHCWLFINRRQPLIAIYFYIRITLTAFASTPIEPIYAQTNNVTLATTKFLNTIALEVMDEIQLDSNNSTAKTETVQYPLYVHEDYLSSTTSSSNSFDI